MLSYRDLHLDQRRIFVDTVQAYQAFQEAEANRRHYAGGMHWKRVGGREYLIRTRGGHGQQHSLGPRSAETEAIYREFRAGKDRAEEAFREQKESLQYQAQPPPRSSHTGSWSLAAQTAPGSGTPGGSSAPVAQCPTAAMSAGPRTRRWSR